MRQATVSKKHRIVIKDCKPCPDCGRTKRIKAKSLFSFYKEKCSKCGHKW